MGVDIITEHQSIITLQVLLELGMKSRRRIRNSRQNTKSQAPVPQLARRSWRSHNTPTYQTANTCININSSPFCYRLPLTLSHIRIGACISSLLTTVSYPTPRRTESFRLQLQRSCAILEVRSRCTPCLGKSDNSPLEKFCPGRPFEPSFSPRRGLLLCSTSR